eukprot:TRINITY_DN17396_c0_g1_i2.p1 TRINITY_DN17396_c0_g1~~TRINITY_DN17396_c0_g1_i2.p1  ORF type:complete len:855 (-),score=141.56 TRINITY_DN17396_c0_g1_i2:284-2848(-)
MTQTSSEVEDDSLGKLVTTPSFGEAYQGAPPSRENDELRTLLAKAQANEQELAILRQKLRENGKRDDLSCPPTLLVTSAGEYAGVYGVVPGKQPNGYPLWKRLADENYIFSGPSCRWFLGDEDEEEAQFEEDTGNYAHLYEHYGLYPHQMPEDGWTAYSEASGNFEDAPRTRVFCPDSPCALRSLVRKAACRLVLADFTNDEDILRPHFALWLKALWRKQLRDVVRQHHADSTESRVRTRALHFKAAERFVLDREWVTVRRAFECWSMLVTLESPFGFGRHLRAACANFVARVGASRSLEGREACVEACLWYWQLFVLQASLERQAQDDDDSLRRVEKLITGSQRILLKRRIHQVWYRFYRDARNEREKQEQEAVIAQAASGSHTEVQRTLMKLVGIISKMERWEPVGLVLLRIFGSWLFLLQSEREIRIHQQREAAMNEELFDMRDRLQALEAKEAAKDALEKEAALLANDGGYDDGATDYPTSPIHRAVVTGLRGHNRSVSPMESPVCSRPGSPPARRGGGGPSGANSPRSPRGFVDVSGACAGSSHGEYERTFSPEEVYALHEAYGQEAGAVMKGMSTPFVPAKPTRTWLEASPKEGINPDLWAQLYEMEGCIESTCARLGGEAPALLIPAVETVEKHDASPRGLGTTGISEPFSTDGVGTAFNFDVGGDRLSPTTSHWSRQGEARGPSGLTTPSRRTSELLQPPSPQWGSSSPKRSFEFEFEPGQEEAAWMGSAESRRHFERLAPARHEELPNWLERPLGTMLDGAETTATSRGAALDRVVDQAEHLLLGAQRVHFDLDDDGFDEVHRERAELTRVVDPRSGELQAWSAPSSRRLNGLPPPGRAFAQGGH